VAHVKCTACTEIRVRFSCKVGNGSHVLPTMITRLFYSEMIIKKNNALSTASRTWVVYLIKARHILLTRR